MAGDDKAVVKAVQDVKEPQPLPQAALVSPSVSNVKKRAAKARKAATAFEPAAKPAAPAKAAAKEKKPSKKDKPKKIKMVRDSFTMPEAEYAQIAALKKKCLKAGVPVKKSELLRCGLAYLANLSDAALLKAVARVEKLKTGRPAKTR